MHADASGNQSIDRAAAIVSLVVAAPDTLSFTRIVEGTGLPRSTVSRLLTSLEVNGLLERDADGTWRAGALFSRYASRFDRIETLVAVARPHLERIGEATGETVNLAVPGGKGVVQIAQVDSAHVLGATTWIGVEVPTHASALGKVMCATGLLPMPHGPLERCTRFTVGTGAEFAAECARIRGLGYAVVHQEFELGLDAIAVPVEVPDAGVVAALGISGPSVRLAPDHAGLGRLLGAEAAALVDAIRRWSTFGPQS